MTLMTLMTDDDDFDDPDDSDDADCNDDHDYLDDLDVQIDCYERHNRYLIAFGVLSPRVVSPGEIPPAIKVVMKDAGMDPASYEGSVHDIRHTVQQFKRENGPAQGKDYSALNDDQLTDDYHYMIFPNITMNVHADETPMRTRHCCGM